MLLPLRYHLDAIGGSKAQQDVVHLTLIDAALRVPDQVPLSVLWRVCGGLDDRRNTSRDFLRRSHCETLERIVAVVHSDVIRPVFQYACHRGAANYL